MNQPLYTSMLRVIVADLGQEKYIVLQFLTESLILTVSGGVLGVGVEGLSP